MALSICSITITNVIAKIFRQGLIIVKMPFTKVSRLVFGLIDFRTRGMVILCLYVTERSAKVGFTTNMSGGILADLDTTAGRSAVGSGSITASEAHTSGKNAVHNRCSIIITF